MAPRYAVEVRVTDLLDCSLLDSTTVFRGDDRDEAAAIAIGFEIHVDDERKFYAERRDEEERIAQSLEDAERRFDAAMRNPKLTPEELETEALRFFCRAYRDPFDTLTAFRRWQENAALEVSQPGLAREQ